MVRPTYAEIDTGAIARNVRAFRELIAPSQVCAVVKADAYGHGDVPVANAALDAGASLVAVALVEEGIRLREAGIGSRILLLSEPGPESAGDVARWELEPTVYSEPFVDALADCGSKIPVHLKVDTGMHRVGAPPADVRPHGRHHHDRAIDAFATHSKSREQIPRPCVQSSRPRDDVVSTIIPPGAAAPADEGARQV